MASKAHFSPCFAPPQLLAVGLDGLLGLRRPSLRRPSPGPGRPTVVSVCTGCFAFPNARLVPQYPASRDWFGSGPLLNGGSRVASGFHVFEPLDFLRGGWISRFQPTITNHTLKTNLHCDVRTSHAKRHLMSVGRLCLPHWHGSSVNLMELQQTLLNHQTFSFTSTRLRRPDRPVRPHPSTARVPVSQVAMAETGTLDTEEKLLAHGPPSFGRSTEQNLDQRQKWRGPSPPELGAATTSGALAFGQIFSPCELGDRFLAKSEGLAWSSFPKRAGHGWACEGMAQVHLNTRNCFSKPEISINKHA